MPRIRTIKPDFFLHEGLAELPAMSRLLFIGLWTQADREGRLEDRPKRIKASIFPYDSCDIEKLLNELVKGGFIIRYKANANRSVEDIDSRAAGQTNSLAIIQIVNFTKHQVINVKEQESILPPCTNTVFAPDEYSTCITGKEGKGKEQERKGSAGAHEMPFSEEEFLEAWQGWLVYKKQIGDSYKSPQSIPLALKNLANASKNDYKKAIAIIHQSIANGWKGLFELKEQKIAPQTGAAEKAQYTREAMVETTNNNLHRIANGLSLDDYKG